MCTYACTHACMHTHMHSRKHACTHTHLTDVCMLQARTHVHIQLPIWDMDVLYQGSYMKNTDAAHTPVTLENVPFEYATF